MTTPADNAAQGGASAPLPGTAEYQQAMIDKASSLSISSVSIDGKQTTAINTPEVPQETPPAATAERPSWLPDRFNSAEEMAASYAELEKKVAVETPKPAEETPQVPTGVDVSKFSSEFETNGALSEASYAELAKAGIDKGMVDAYIAGQVSLAQNYQNAGHEVAGGQERYGQMVEWAKANLSKPEIAAFNAQVGNGDVETMKLAVAGLNSKFVAATGNSPSGLLSGGASATVNTSAYQSRAQVTEAMSDPRYASDPAYRQAVRAKLANSNVF